MNSFILSTCGTSVLTNGLDPDSRKLLLTHANVSKLEADVAAQLAPIIASRRAELMEADASKAARMSAELNGLLAYYQRAPDEGARKRDAHYLLASDTKIGREARDLVMGWLTAQGFSTVQPFDVPGLQAGRLDDFRVGLSDLGEQLNEAVEAHRRQGYRVAFNLTGGFKSVNALIQTLGALWADEVFFLFESSSELIRIPKLPVTLDFESSFRAHLATIRRLAVIGEASASSVAELPESLLFRSDDTVALSPWVEAQWHQVRVRIYGEKLLPPWSEQVEFGPGLARSVGGLSAARLAQVNERIDDLCRLTTSNHHLRRLDLKPLKGGGAQGSTHECDAWADGDARRLYLHRDGGTWIVDRLDKALH